MKSDRYWLACYALPQGLDSELRTLLVLLSSVCSVGNVPEELDACIALDLYKVPEDGVDPNDWSNTEVGDLVYRSKYWADSSASSTLTTRLGAVIRDHPDYHSADLILSIPGRRANAQGHGERLARSVAEQTGVPFRRTTPSYTQRPPAKEGFVLKRQHVTIEADLQDLTALIVDDVFRSGRSMAAVATRARERGATRVLGLVAAKTLRN